MKNLIDNIIQSYLICLSICMGVLLLFYFSIFLVHTSVIFSKYLDKYSNFLPKTTEVLK